MSNNDTTIIIIKLLNKLNCTFHSKILSSRLLNVSVCIYSKFSRTKRSFLVMVFSVYSCDERATSHRLITFQILNDAILSIFEPNSYLHAFNEFDTIFFFYCLFMENGNVHVRTQMHSNIQMVNVVRLHRIEKIIAVCLVKSLFCWIIQRMKCRFLWCTKKFISICCFHFKNHFFLSLAFGSFIFESDVVLSLFARVHDY